ncbi:sulfite exporter TauE/SafE family protein [Pseudooceanicola sp. CBS1P-1]|uniref:Probable membrane transporter protein n=1 Tax=Pseudooceanicola albus TaxID=2692189 RepID=A0A6L7G063_9RHOB|nr:MULTISPECIES: sulfite exporter TauE/SafE family protein [Pseudooceanicola]MBT9382304.1 sulfite exporter TauE/SafE family protein [Pseudooceanicola endophyticus]MXN16846.1 TSUP family transporter [Pseudooceanicola albus]
MTLYLPIAEVSVNAWVILGLGGLVGFLSGLFGVGGGFLLTPLLFFAGIPPAVAVSTQANQIVASSFSGTLAHLRRGTLDLKMGLMLLAGGLAGSAVGVWIFNLLSRIGQVDLMVQLFYVVFLGGIGAMMFVESARALTRKAPVRRKRQRGWAARMPLRMRFRTSGLVISVIPVLGIGFLCGVLAAIMGVGGGFVMLPAMIYLLKMPTKIVVGTSLFQIMFTSAFTTVLHAATDHSVDVLLALLLSIGGVLGAQFGARFGARLRGEQLRILLSILVLIVCFKVALDLVLAPDDPFSFTMELMR